jgi:hypothetical protein
MRRTAKIAEKEQCASREARQFFSAALRDSSLPSALNCQAGWNRTAGSGESAALITA